MKLALTVLLAASLVAPRATAAAEPRPDPRTAEARAHFKAGTQLYKQARYREAIGEFETAYQLKPHGVLHFNLAQCHEKLGDIPKALRAYRQYLREVPAAEDRATVQTAMGNLEKRLAEKGLQQLRVFSDPSDAEVKVDGKVAGRTPWAGELPLGRHAVQLSLAGREVANRDIDLVADRSADLEIQLAVAAEPAAVVAPPPPPPAPPAVTTAPPEATAPAASTGAAVAPEKPRVVTWIVVGVAAASLAAAVGCGVAAKSSSDELRSKVHDQKTAQGLHDDAATRQTASNVLYGVGAAAGVAGGVLFFVGRF